MILKQSDIKTIIKDRNKRCSKEFMSAFNAHVEADLQRCLNEHNGGRKTLDAGVVRFLFPEK